MFSNQNALINIKRFINSQSQRILMIRKLVLFTMLVGFLLCSSVEANQNNVTTVKEAIVKQSLELGIDPALALSIAKSESGFRHETKSPYGAVGVFQLMPSTAKRLGVNPYCLHGNIKGGLMYYQKMYRIFGNTELALAAYNAGPTAVKRYNSVPPYGETKRFVNKIMLEYKAQKTNPDPAIKKAKQPAVKLIKLEALEATKAPIPAKATI